MSGRFGAAPLQVLPRGFHEPREPLRLPGERLLAETGDAVVAPLFALVRALAFLELFDESLPQHELEGPVERGGPEPELSLRLLDYGAGNPGSVEVPAREGEKDIV